MLQELIGDITISDGSITGDSATKPGANNISTADITGKSNTYIDITVASGSKIGDVTIAVGSITSDTATIVKGTNNISTSGTISSGDLTAGDITVSQLSSNMLIVEQLLIV